MKKTVSMVLILCLALACAVPAFADQTQKAPVYELYSVDGYYIDDLGNEKNYSYHVPQINAFGADADDINAEIAERFGEPVESQFSYMTAGTSLWLYRTEWEAYWSGNRLFLLIKAEMNGDCTDYAAYGYDFETGSRVTNEMILEQRGIEKDAYLESLREKVRLLFEEKYVPIPEGVKTSLSHDTLLEKTLSRLDMEQPMFLNALGEIVTIVKIESVAGSGWYYALAATFPVR